MQHSFLLKPIVDTLFRLQKYPGKGGWTFIPIPSFPSKNKSPFGYRRVKGSIDGFKIKNYHLMPMKDGNLFLPVKSEIRKHIGKTQGNMVHVVLYYDNAPLEIPAELLLCLKDEPGLYEKFMKLSEGYRKEFITWIYSAKKTETRANRIAKTIELVLHKKTLSRQE